MVAVKREKLRMSEEKTNQIEKGYTPKRPLDIVNYLGFKTVDELSKKLDSVNEIYVEWKTFDSNGNTILLRTSARQPDNYVHLTEDS